MLKNLKVINYPDPRLKKSSAPVEAFDAHLRELAERMLQLMREHRGVGLGLPVARGFTEAVGGDLRIDDTPGGGTTMVFTLEAVAS